MIHFKKSFIGLVSCLFLVTPISANNSINPNATSGSAKISLSGGSTVSQHIGANPAMPGAGGNGAQPGTGTGSSNCKFEAFGTHYWKSSHRGKFWRRSEIVTGSAKTFINCGGGRPLGMSIVNTVVSLRVQGANNQTVLYLVNQSYSGSGSVSVSGSKEHRRVSKKHMLCATSIHDATINGLKFKGTARSGAANCRGR